MRRFEGLTPALRLFLSALVAVAIAATAFLVQWMGNDGPHPLFTGMHTALVVLLVVSLALALVCVEVTRRSHARTLHEEGRARALIAATSDAIITVDARGVIESFNPAASRLFQWVEREVVGKPFTLLVDAAQREELARQFAADLLNPVHNLPRSLGEVLSQRRDGTTFVTDASCGAFRSKRSWTVFVMLRDATERKRTETALRAQESYFRSLIDHSADIIWLIDEHGRQLFVSPAVSRILGIDRDAWNGRSALDLIWPDDLPRGRELLRRILAVPGVPVPWQLRMRHADGEPRWLEGTASNLLADPSIRGIVVNAGDVTDHFHDHERLRTLSRAVEQNPASIVITDREGTIQYVNPKFCAVTGYSSDEVLGKKPSVLKSGEMPAEGYRKLWETLLVGGEWRGEFHNRRKDGTLFWEYASISPIADENGRITQFVAVKEDITERRRAEEQLFESREELDAAFANAPIGMALEGLDGCYQRVNRSFCEILGFTAEQLTAMTFWDITHPDDLDATTQHRGAMLDGTASSRDLVKRYVHQDGRVVWAQTSMSLIHDKSGDPLYFVVQLQDISSRRLAQAQLTAWAEELESANVRLQEEQAQRAKVEAELRLSHKLEAIGQLAAGIAHEINTPIQFVGDSAHFLANSFTDVLRALDTCHAAAGTLADIPGREDTVAQVERTLEETDIEFTREEIPRALARIFDGVGRVSVIVQAMKEFAHPGQREAAPADLNRMLRNTLTVARNEYKHVADIETELGELPLVPCDIGELSQVFLNLVVNSAQAIGEQAQGSESRGRITVRSRLEGDDAVIQIEDTGPGIPDSIRDRVFDPFFTTKPPGKGTGQGLAIARTVVVERLGGKLTFESHPGRGTIFTIRLPATGRPHAMEAAA